MKIILMIACLVLTGCATTQNPVVTPQQTEVTKSPVSGKELDKPKDRVDIDPYLLEPCPDFAPMTSSNPTPQDVLNQKAKDVAVRKDCANRHNSLIKVVKDAFNTR